MPGSTRLHLPALPQQNEAPIFHCTPDAHTIKKNQAVCFVTTNEARGGNAGRPVFDAGERPIRIRVNGNCAALSQQLSDGKDF